MRLFFSSKILDEIKGKMNKVVGLTYSQWICNYRIGCTAKWVAIHLRKKRPESLPLICVGGTLALSLLLAMSVV